MSDWWIDEVRYPGPVEEVARGIITYFREVWQSDGYQGICYYVFEGARGDDINKWLPQDEVWALFQSEFVYVGRLQSIQTKVAHHTMGASPQYDFTIETKLTRKEQEAQWSQSLSPQQPSASLKPVSHDTKQSTSTAPGASGEWLQTLARQSTERLRSMSNLYT